MGTAKAPLLEESRNDSTVPESDIRDALARVLDSSAFHGSARCQQFLRFVVERTLDGEAASIKERTIAVEVFGRPVDFEGSEDSIVRVKAGEIRRRLTQYYESAGQLDPVLITLPRGGYVPCFEERNVLSAAGMDEAPSPETVKPKRHLAGWMAGVALAAIAAAVFSAMPGPENTVQEVWAPMMRASGPVLIYVPVPDSYRLDGPAVGRTSREAPFEARVALLNDKVGLGAAAGAAEVAAFCAREDHPFRLKFGQELHFSDLRAQPAFLLGAFSSQWGPRMSKGLRFELRWPGGCGQPELGSCIFDTASKQGWFVTGRDSRGGANKDVAIAARLVHEQTGLPLMIAAGITTYGTQGAAEFLLSEQALSDLKAKAGDAWNHRSFQAVIEVPVIEGSAGKPNLVAWHFW